MAEVDLLPSARLALQVSRVVLPRYRSRFSEHQSTPPQLLAILCLMRYGDWSFREAEVRLGEHRELHQTLEVSSVPDFTTRYRFLQCLDGQVIDRAVGETVRQPECNCCVERFIRALKEQLMWVKVFQNVEELCWALAEFRERYNQRWIVQCRGYFTPAQARQPFPALEAGA